MKTSKLSLLLLVISFVCACKFPEIKQLQLKRPFNEIKADLNNPGNFESVNMTSNSNSTNGVTENLIELELVNGKNIPANSDSFRLFIKSKAKLVADEIINKQDYSSIIVILKTESKTGMITTSSSNSFSFSFAALEEAVPQIDSANTDSINAPELQ